MVNEHQTVTPDVDHLHVLIDEEARAITLAEPQTDHEVVAAALAAAMHAQAYPEEPSIETVLGERQSVVSTHHDQLLKVSDSHLAKEPWLNMSQEAFMNLPPAPGEPAWSVEAQRNFSTKKSAVSVVSWSHTYSQSPRACQLIPDLVSFKVSLPKAWGRHHPSGPSKGPERSQVCQVHLEQELEMVLCIEVGSPHWDGQGLRSVCGTQGFRMHCHGDQAEGAVRHGSTTGRGVDG